MENLWDYHAIMSDIFMERGSGPSVCCAQLRNKIQFMRFCYYPFFDSTPRRANPVHMDMVGGRLAGPFIYHMEEASGMSQAGRQAGRQARQGVAHKRIRLTCHTLSQHFSQQVVIIAARRK